MFHLPSGLYFSACLGSLFLAILSTCCSHFVWYCCLLCVSINITLENSRVLLDTYSSGHSASALPPCFEETCLLLYGMFLVGAVCDDHEG